MNNLMIIIISSVLFYCSYSQCAYRNGVCQTDYNYNTAQCGYDYGDCCEESCLAGPYAHQCGVHADYDCRDPRYAATDSPTVEPTTYRPTATRNPTINPSSSPITNKPTTAAPTTYECDNRIWGDGRCDKINNNKYCKYDGGDCCSGSCIDGGIYKNTSNLCERNEVSALYNCTDPLYATPSPTTIYDGLLFQAASRNKDSYSAIKSSEICMDHPYSASGEFVTMGTWRETTSETMKMFGGYYDGSNNWYDLCSYNNSLSSCPAAEYIDNSNLYLLTYCCKSNIWVIAPIDDSIYTWLEQWNGIPEIRWFAIGDDIESIDIWYLWSSFESEYAEYEVTMFDMNCTDTGVLVSSILSGLLFIILLSIFIKLLVKNKCSFNGLLESLLDSFEKFSSNIEFIIQGICLGDSFLSSLIVSIDLGIPTQSAGIIVMTFGVVNFILFAIRFKLSGGHLLESENFGSLADFTFDFSLSIFLVFMDFDVGEEFILLIIATYAGVVEEFIQLLSKIKCKCLQKMLNYYLLQSGRILSIMNMFTLFFASFIYFTFDGELQYGWATVLLLISLIMLFGGCYSFYLYVGCCGKCGGHKKVVNKTTNNDENDENVVKETNDTEKTENNDDNDDKKQNQTQNETELQTQTQAQIVYNK